jgi:hypothetical protein
MVVQQNARVAELEEANARLLVELNGSRCREHALTSDYEGLHKDFDDLRTLHNAVVKGKADLEKMEHEKAQRFQNSLCKKLGELRVDMEATVAALGGRCMDFFCANNTVTNFLEWFWTEVQALPIAFSECNDNFICFSLIGIIKMLVGCCVGICQSLKSWHCLAMTRSFTMSLMMLVKMRRGL